MIPHFSQPPSNFCAPSAPRPRNGVCPFRGLCFLCFLASCASCASFASCASCASAYFRYAAVCDRLLSVCGRLLSDPNTAHPAHGDVPKLPGSHFDALSCAPAIRTQKLWPFTKMRTTPDAVHSVGAAISRPPTLQIFWQNRFGRIRYRCCQCTMFQHNTSEFHL